MSAIKATRVKATRVKATLMKRNFVLAFLLLATAAEARTPAPRGPLTAEERAQIELFRNAAQSVVYVTNLAVRRDVFSMDTEVQQGTGSGFVWDDAGHIVTNYHVVEHAQGLMVTLSDHSQHRAEIVGVERDKDVAVIKIDAKPGQLKPIPVGTSSDLAVGQTVYAIGNPFGLDHTLTMGVISALDREIKSGSGQPIEGVIQTDTVINPGNSGGPLLDTAGRLIGMNTAIYSPTGSSVGIGFAVPVDSVNRVAEQLLHFGHAVHPTLGVRIAADSLARNLNLHGVLIVDVDPGSGAEAAGLQPTRREAGGGIALGDVIVEADAKPVRTSADLYRILDTHAPGDHVKLGLLREGRIARVAVELSLSR